MSKVPAVVKQSPTATIGTLATGTMTVLALLVAHGVIPADVAKDYGPWVVLVVVAGYFLLTWLHVTPWVKAQQLSAQLADGRWPDAEWARAEALFADIVHGALGSSWLDTHATGDSHPDAAKPAPPATMQAGAAEARGGSTT